MALFCVALSTFKPSTLSGFGRLPSVGRAIGEEHDTIDGRWSGNVGPPSGKRDSSPLQGLVPAFQV